MGWFESPTTSRARRARATKILIVATKLVEKYGWIQGEFGTRAVGFCASGAVDEASRVLRVTEGESDFDIAALRLARNYLIFTIQNETGEPYSIATWNDEPGRTKAEVVRMLAKAANE